MLTFHGQPMMQSNGLSDVPYHCIVPHTTHVSEVAHGGEESLPCLPRRTVVLITGNNRTKKALIGQQAIVKRAVGLGGWHHCVLQDGSEIKLQRNALSVVEMGPPETFDDPSQGSSSDTEAREPKIESLTPRVRRPLRTLIHSPELPLFKKVETINGSGMRDSTCPVVDFHKLNTASLKRYRQAFQLPELDAATPKADLATAVQLHFSSQEVDEQEVLEELVFALRRRCKQQQLLLREHLHTAADDPYSSNSEDQDTFSKQQMLGAHADAARQQFRQMLLQQQQQQFFYLGPNIFQQQQQQQQQ